jgi:hypothetical protein
MIGCMQRCLNPEDWKRFLARQSLSAEAHDIGTDSGATES